MTFAATKDYGRLNEAISFLKNNGYIDMSIRDGELLQYYEWKMNCWGLTARLKGWVKRMFWMSNSDITNYLVIMTDEVRESDTLVGDIVVFYSDNTCSYVVHTGIYLGDGLMLHKPGSLDMNIAKISSYYNSYGNTVRFHREK